VLAQQTVNRDHSCKIEAYTKQEGKSMSISPRELVSGAIEIASLPEIFLKVNEMIDSPRHSAADIGRIISHDAALSARLLKIANSVFYGFPSQIDTISRAIIVIGTRELRDLILATSVMRVFKGLPNDLVTMEDFWRHSICCGLAARSLAAQRGEQQVERYFVAGLLHDIGSLLVYRKIPELAREALLRAQYNNVPLYRAEQDVMGFDHAAVGVEILRKWKLPESLQEATEFHHNPGMAQRFPRDTALIHALQYGNSGDPHVAPMDSQAWRLADLSDDTISMVISEVEKQFNSAVELFQPEPRNAAANLH
jgi:putative nucleotidyltransferase with HDIG domain